jgi:regulator of replication initiation timing
MQNSVQVIATIEKHHKLKETINSLIEEWERLSMDLEHMKRDFEKAKTAIET